MLCQYIHIVISYSGDGWDRGDDVEKVFTTRSAANAYKQAKEKANHDRYREWYIVTKRLTN